MKQSITQKSLIDQFVIKFFLLFFLGFGLSSNAQNTLNTLGLSASTPASAAYSLRQLSLQVNIDGSISTIKLVVVNN